MENTHKIRTEAVSVLRDRIANLNKRAAKNGLPALELVVGEPYVVFEPAPEGSLDREIERVYNDVEIIGSSPVLEGWTFVARLETTPAGNLVHTVPGVEIQVPERFRSTGPDCDHCRLDRRRNDTYVLMDESGEFVQVGRTCLRDFTGHADPIKAARWFEMLMDLDADIREGDGGFLGEGGGSFVPALRPTYIAAIAAAVIRHFGYVSKARARDYGEMATSEIITRYLFPGSDADRQFAAENPIDFNHDDHSEGERVAEYVASLEGGNDFEMNLKVIFDLDAVELNKAGYIAAAVQGARKAEQAKVEREAQAATSEPVPEGKDVVTGVVSKTDVKDNPYDGSIRFVMTVTDDRGFKVWGSIPSTLVRTVERHDDLVGKKVSFTATLNRSDRDEFFGFFKRPSKASLVE